MTLWMIAGCFDLSPPEPVASASCQCRLTPALGMSEMDLVDTASLQFGNRISSHFVTVEFIPKGELAPVALSSILQEVIAEFEPVGLYVPEAEQPPCGRSVAGA